MKSKCLNAKTLNQKDSKIGSQIFTLNSLAKIRNGYKIINE